MEWDATGGWLCDKSLLCSKGVGMSHLARETYSKTKVRLGLVRQSGETTREWNTGQVWQGECGTLVRCGKESVGH